VDRRTRRAAIASNTKLRSQAAGALHRCVTSQPLWRDRAREVAARELASFPPEAVLRALSFYGRDLEEAVGGLPEGPASVQLGVAALLAAAALRVASEDPTMATARCSFHLDDACAPPLLAVAPPIAVMPSPPRAAGRRLPASVPARVLQRGSALRVCVALLRALRQDAAVPLVACWWWWVLLPRTSLPDLQLDPLPEL
jgi:hypothetical protein